MSRRLFQLLALLGVLVAARAGAVSLGDDVVLSRLGDPLEVEIGVLDWEDMDLERVQITAANIREYEAFDLTWLPVLDNLHFNLVGPDPDGRLRLLVSSREPFDEPYLELLLVLRWPGGSLLREYVLLFDPPTVPDLQAGRTGPPPAVTEAPVAPENVMPDRAPVVQASDESPPVPPVEESVPEQAAADAAVPAAREQVAIEVDRLVATPAPVPAGVRDLFGRQGYEVQPGDSLWNISMQFLPAGVAENIYQMLLSLHALNRDAFVNGNISLLKANVTLRLPLPEDIAAIQPAGAQAEFERLWEAGTRRFDELSAGNAVPVFAPGQEAPVEPDVVQPAVADAGAGEAGLLAEGADTPLILASDSRIVPPRPVPQSGMDDAPATAVAQGDTQSPARPAASPAPRMPSAVSTPPEAETAAIDFQASEAGQGEESTSVPPGPVLADERSDNPALQRILAAASSTQDLIATREQRIAELAIRMERLQSDYREAQAITAELDDTLRRLAVERPPQPAISRVLAATVLALAVALFTAVVQTFRQLEQLRDSRSLADRARMTAGSAVAEPAAADAASPPPAIPAGDSAPAATHGTLLSPVLPPDDATGVDIGAQRFHHENEGTGGHEQPDPKDPA